MSTDHLTLEIQNLKALRSFRWSPSGVSVLVGPNGTGKSTALRTFAFLGTALNYGIRDALVLFGGGPLRHRDASASDAPRIQLALGDAQWTLTLQGEVGDTVTEGKASVLRARGLPGNPMLLRVPHHGATHGLNPQAHETALGAMRSAPTSATSQVPGMIRLASFVANSHYLRRPELDFLRENGSAEATDTTLSHDAKNLFTVLKNWTLNGDYSEQREFVLRSMEELFPSEFRRLDFSQAGSRTSASVLPRIGKEKMLPTDWSDGFFVCLAMLTGLASVQGGICSIDEPENSLHPELIRRTIELMREWSRKHDTTVILATHSPVVLNEFREEPEKVFVMQPGHEQLPVRLDELKKREWLEHFALGDLYVQNEVGAPTQQ